MQTTRKNDNKISVYLTDKHLAFVIARALEAKISRSRVLQQAVDTLIEQADVAGR